MEWSPRLPAGPAYAARQARKGVMVTDVAELVAM